MKKLYFLSVFMLFTSIIYSQETHISRTGFDTAIIKTNLTQDQIYSKAKEWVQKTYKNPSFVLVGDIQNSYLRINGFKERAWMIKNIVDIWYDIEYYFIIDIKGNFVYLTFNVDNAISYKNWFKKDGTLRNQFKESKPSIENSFNGIAKSLVDYINK